MPECVDFFENAMGLKCRVRDETMGYADFEGQGTNLAILDKKNMQKVMGGNWKSGNPDGFELTFVSDNVKATLDKAVSAGAELVSPISEKGWSNEVCYVKAPGGILVEICAPFKPGGQ